MFERAFKCNSVNFKAIFSIAMHALQNGRYDEAEIWLKNILWTWPTMRYAKET